MTDLDIQELANLTAGDADVDNFERLFTKLKEMKGKTQNPINHHPVLACYTVCREIFGLTLMSFCCWFSFIFN